MGWCEIYCNEQFWLQKKRKTILAENQKYLNIEQIIFMAEYGKSDCSGGLELTPGGCTKHYEESYKTTRQFLAMEWTEL